MIPFDKGKPFLGHFFTYQKDKIKKKNGKFFKVYNLYTEDLTYVL